MDLSDLPHNSKIVEPGTHYNDLPVKNTDGMTLYFYYGVFQNHDGTELFNHHGQIWESTQGDARDFAVKVNNMLKKEKGGILHTVFVEIFAVQLIDDGKLVFIKKNA